MKKNISINISGIIFHIEEDGYSKLKEYLESINSYFSSYDDSQEIIADIESRIAEIFLSKLDDGKQVINIEDVDGLIATMGTTADFEAIEDDVNVVEESAEEPKTEQEEKSKEQEVPKRLFRDEKKRILGGVASGMAYYFGIDPLWVRLIMVLMFLNVFFGPISGVVLIAYIVLWIVVPGSYDLEDGKEIKKMYRDPDHRVMGGVASGIAAYFGVDTTVIRLVFVLSIFLGGSGLILYIILWIITPEANSITEKMQMQGEPVTLSNIEHNVKESLNVKEGEENLLVKILLFPFRVIAAIFQAIGKLLGPASRFIVEALRIFAGLVITFVGISGMVGIIIAASVLLGLISTWGHVLVFHDFPMVLIKNSFPTIGYISLFIASIVPLLGITFMGISVLIKRWVLNGTVGWTIFALWVFSMIGIGFTVPKVASDFSNDGEYKETQTYDFGSDQVTLGIRDAGIEDYDMVNLKLRGHTDSVFRLDSKFRSRGYSRANAVENAKMVTYNVTREDSNLLFDTNLAFKDDAVFRAQELNMTLYIPYEKEFMIEEELEYILSNTIRRNGYKTWQIDGNKWMFTEEGLNCTTCDSGISYRRNEGRSGGSDNDYYGQEMIFEMNDFNQVEAKGNITIVITKEDDFHVQVRGKDRYLDDVYVNKVEDVLTVELDADRYDYLNSNDKKPVKVYVSMPELYSVEGKIAADFEVSDFESNDFSIFLSGASSADIDIDSDNIDIRLKGGSRLDLSGNAKNVDVDISGGSSLKSYDLMAKSVNIEASGASSAKVYASDKLFAESSGMSSIRYKGGPDVTINDRGKFSSVDKAD